MNPQYADIFYKEILKIHQAEGVDHQARCGSLQLLLNRIFIVATEEEKIQFSNLFARISYTFQKFEIPRKHQFVVHSFRRLYRENQQNEKYEEWTPLYELGMKATIQLIEDIWKVKIPDTVRPIMPGYISLQLQPAEIEEFISQRRVVALRDDEAKQQLICIDEQTGREVPVQYNIADRNENFNVTIRTLRDVFGFPVTLNLIDVEVEKGGIFRPRAFVVEPDFLVDVTAVAECFQPDCTEPILYLLKKFMPFTASSHLILGNIANFFLDELMSNPKAQFMELFPKVFGLHPLQFAMMGDAEVRDIMERAKGHFSVIQKMVNGAFQKEKIELEHCYLEPTFYAEKYGLQGRLDALHQKENTAAIVELKSGKPFMANLYGLSNNHFTQTLLYDLLVRSAYGKAIQPTNYILYSSSYERPLRLAPPVKAQQMEALQTRNQLVAIERQLSKIGQSPDANLSAPLLEKLKVDQFPHIKGFHKRDIELFEKTYKAMTPLERKYFNAFTGFIAREHQLAKTGIQGLENVNGLAGLWLDTFAEKETNFDIISQLRIKENHAGETDPFIIFEKTDKTNPLANFRKGDIATLYPWRHDDSNVLQSQVFKVTIVEIGKETVTVRLRSKQFNTSIFEKNDTWNLEHDLLDSSFVGMYRSLFEFAGSPAEKKAQLLTLRSPTSAHPASVDLPEELTAEQKIILNKIIASRDYFLLWGPPGTGKTSMMLKHLAGYFLNHTDENILLLAYTNRAVDEICTVLESLGDDVKDSYLRIGSRYGTDSEFHNQLLDAKIETAQSRNELRNILEQHRIFVATVSSFQGKSDLLKLKKFNRVIIDEASQILEPMLMGFLTQFEHFTLIGDHKQLPAVVVQDARNSAVADGDLQNIGLDNLRNSLFERLFLRCETQGWDWAYDKLSHQGRMHSEIMDFPNEIFYKGFLQTLPAELPVAGLQHHPIIFQLPESPTDMERLLLSRRLLLISTQTDTDDGYHKTNTFEAQKIVELVQSFDRILKTNKRTASIGVITPYRAQIALIRSKLLEHNMDPDAITIDTVERYQGGARDVILISLCTNTDTQLASMTSLATDGTDRKLNVALTRARQHLVILGNVQLLKGNPVYAKLVAWCGEKTDN